MADARPLTLSFFGKVERQVKRPAWLQFFDGISEGMTEKTVNETKRNCRRISGKPMPALRRTMPGRAGDARRRRDVRRGHADRICDSARTGRARRRRRQQPVLGRADAPYRHAGARGAADADAGARRGRRGDQGQAGAVVELVAAGRGLSGGEVTVRSRTVIPDVRSTRLRCAIAHREFDFQVRNCAP